MLSSIQSFCQIPIYKWVGGDTTVNATGSLQKTYVGPRQNAASWQDEGGNYYILGEKGMILMGKQVSLTIS